jgi:hypothetical protein
MFFDFGLKDLIVPIAIFGFAEIKSYFTRRMVRKQFEKIGKIVNKIDILGLNENSETGKHILYIMGGALILFSIYAGLKTLDYKTALSCIGYGLTIIYLPFRLKEQFSIIIGEKGFTSKEFTCTWDELEIIEWEEDTLLQKWAVKFYKINQYHYHKIYVANENKEKLQILLDKKINSTLI